MAKFTSKQKKRQNFKIDMPKKRYAQKISSKIKICSKFTNVRAGKKIELTWLIQYDIKEKLV